MKTILCTLLVLFTAFGVSAATYDKLVSSLVIKVSDISASGSISVEISNTSKEPIRLWRDSSSLGAARWRVVRIRNGRLETFFQNPNQRFTRNSAVPVELAGGAHTQQKLDLNGGNWCGFGHCAEYNERGFGGQQVSFEPNDIVVVTYDVPRSDEAVK